MLGPCGALPRCGPIYTGAKRRLGPEPALCPRSEPAFALVAAMGAFR
jgi:hypothetical protein